MKLKVTKHMDDTKRNAKFGARIMVDDLGGEISPITDRRGQNYNTFTVFERSEEALKHRVEEVVARAKLNLARRRHLGVVPGPVNGGEEHQI